MKDLTQTLSAIKVLKVGDIVEGEIVGRGRSAVYLDLGSIGTGIIYGKEYQIARDLLRKSKDGEKVFAKITSLENEDGYIELSANKAGQEFAWDTIKEKKEKEEIVKVKIVGANKGGLLAKLMNIPAFLPVSQLSSKNYPKVDGGDTSKILRELQRFVGTEMDVRVLDFSQSEEKLILSERVKEMERAKELLSNYNVGDIVDGEIKGIADFGAFVSFGEDIEGLIHISELAWQIIKEPSEIVKEGDKIKAQIIEINNDRVFLSLKALKDNPWKEIEKEYKVGDKVKGKVSQINSFGIFVQILNKKKNTVQGLCHISEFETAKKMNESIEVDKEYSFEIVSIDSQEHRMILKPLI